MNFFILASFLIVTCLVTILIRKDNSTQKKAENNFWDKEHKANFVRKKSLEHLQYITIPEDILAMKPTNPSKQTLSYLEELNDLSCYKIVNLTGISNTDLKLTYGTANITALSEYDFHYTRMVTLLQSLAESLVASGDKELALHVLEFSVSTGSDVSKTYYLLAELYQEIGTPEKIHFLIQQAEAIPSLMRNSILRNLRASGQ